MLQHILAELIFYLLCLNSLQGKVTASISCDSFSTCLSCSSHIGCSYCLADSTCYSSDSPLISSCSNAPAQSTSCPSAYQSIADTADTNVYILASLFAALLAVAIAAFTYFSLSRKQLPVYDVYSQNLNKFWHLVVNGIASKWLILLISVILSLALFCALLFNVWATVGDNSIAQPKRYLFPTVLSRVVQPQILKSDEDFAICDKDWPTPAYQQRCVLYTIGIDTVFGLNIIGLVLSLALTASLFNTILRNKVFNPHQSKLTTLITICCVTCCGAYCIACIPTLNTTLHIFNLSNSSISFSMYLMIISAALSILFSQFFLSLIMHIHAPNKPNQATTNQQLVNNDGRRGDLDASV
jgi:hypothetical protein